MNQPNQNYARINARVEHSFTGIDIEHASNNLQVLVTINGYRLKAFNSSEDETKVSFSDACASTGSLDNKQFLLMARSER